jgi:hypothetical protein
MSDTKDLVIDKINEILATTGLMKALSINNINEKPHRFTIGPQHIKHAAEKHSGMLGLETLKAVQCAYPRCTTSYDEHTSNKVLFLQLQRNGSNEEANVELKKIVDIMKENDIEGIVMVESDPEYRIT